MEDYSSAELKAYVKDEGGAVNLDLRRKGLCRMPDAGHWTDWSGGTQPEQQ